MTKDIEKKLKTCEKEKAEYLAGWQRAKADFLNYQKQETERVGEVVGSARTELILEMLKILDNLERASRQNFPKENFGGEGTQRFIQGFWQIKKQFENFLKNQGVEEIKAMGEKFNPDLHEAIEQVTAKNKESGNIIEVIQKGYLINGQLLRPAKVKVTK